MRLAPGAAIRIVNTHGSQVVDTWAFNAADLNEHMSMEHTRPTLGTIFPKAGMKLYATAAGRSSPSRRTPRPACTTR